MSSVVCDFNIKMRNTFVKHDAYSRVARKQLRDAQELRRQLRKFPFRRPRGWRTVVTEPAAHQYLHIRKHLRIRACECAAPTFVQFTSERNREINGMHQFLTAVPVLGKI